MLASGRILIVDDDQSVVEALSAALGPFYEVLTAQTGSAALEVIVQQKPDLVLLDYLLPDVSGLTFLRNIKQFAPSLFVILMTGYGSEGVSVESFRSGARDYLKKPFGLPDLLARIERLLAARHGSAPPRDPILLSTRSAISDPGSGPRAAGLQRALAFIEGSLDTPLRLDQVSREAGMSKFHFCRAFKAHAGLTFREYLARRRITRAAELLRDKKRSVTEVCLKTGLRDMTHFGRVLRKLTGQPPSLYRRTLTTRPPDDAPASGVTGSGRP